MRGRFGTGATAPSRRDNVVEWFKEATARAMQRGGYVQRDSWDHVGSLSQCLCGAPTWQQPCPFCGFYPQGDDPEERARVRGTMTKGEFVKRVEKAGGLVPLWVADKKKSVAYAIAHGRQRSSSLKETVECQRYADAVDAALNYAKQHKERYTPEEIWDAMQDSGQRKLPGI